jgi:hypothetical protein
VTAADAPVGLRFAVEWPAEIARPVYYVLSKRLIVFKLETRLKVLYTFYTNIPKEARPR